jgi:hypothetical protein
MRTLIATLLTWVLIGSAQQAPPAPRTATTPKAAVKFESNVQLVVVDVTVKDKSGNPIEGLTAKDFSIAEDGKPQ